MSSIEGLIGSVAAHGLKTVYGLRDGSYERLLQYRRPGVATRHDHGVHVDSSTGPVDLWAEHVPAQ